MGEEREMDIDCRQGSYNSPIVTHKETGYSLILIRILIRILSLLALNLPTCRIPELTLEQQVKCAA